MWWKWHNSGWWMNSQTLWKTLEITSQTCPSPRADLPIAQISRSWSCTASGQFQSFDLISCTVPQAGGQLLQLLCSIWNRNFCQEINKTYNQPNAARCTSTLLRSNFTCGKRSCTENLTKIRGGASKVKLRSDDSTGWSTCWLWRRRTDLVTPSSAFLWMRLRLCWIEFVGLNSQSTSEENAVNIWYNGTVCHD